MKTSDTLDKLAPALAKVQAAIKPASKDSTNPHFKSKYADLTAVWDALHLALSDNGFALVQLPVHADDQRVHLTTRLLHSSGQWLEETASIPIVKLDPHGYGSGLTYLRRYSAAALAFLATEDDDANTAAKVNGADRPNTATQVAHDAFDELPEETQVYCRTEAIKIIAMHERGEIVGEYVARQEYDTECKLGVWSLLPSAVRTAIKKQAPPPKKPSAAELASQP